MNPMNEIVNVLLVDDDEIDRKLVKLILLKNISVVRFNSENAQSISEATAKLSSGSYDIILLDLNLPDSNGIQTVKTIFKMASDTPIVVLTGLDDEDAGLDSIRNGAEDYLVKGEGLEYTLVRTIRYAIERKKINANIRETTKELEQINLSLIKATETANQMAAEADCANNSKSEFLANMSHEIRTPMNSIMGFSDLLEEENLTESQKKYVDTIRESGKSLLILINDILDFSKIVAGKMQTEINTCKLADIMNHIDSLLRPSAIKKGLDFQVLQCGQLPAKIKTDSTRMGQCLINLVNNALKFTEKGHVYVNVSQIIENDEPFICFDVEDTGIGIPENKQQSIFESFTQVDGSTTRKYGGTGLGLTITKQLCELLGGTISLKSQVGKGSVFTMKMPVGMENNYNLDTNKYEFVDELIIPIDADSQILRFEGKILVAEDNLSNQMLMRILLEKMGLKVDIASDGIEAIKLIGKNHYELILIDMQMPNLNGYDATKRIRQMGIKTPLVALTANVMDGDEQKCLDCGCHSYLSKPINKQKLKLKIAEFLIPLEVAK